MMKQNKMKANFGLEYYGSPFMVGVAKLVSRLWWAEKEYKKLNSSVNQTSDAFKDLKDVL